MGAMCSWVAVQGAAKAEVLGTLELAETGEEVLPGEESSEFCCCEFPGGWFVIYSEDFDWATPELTVDLSRFGPVLGCRYENKVEMTSTAWVLRDGAEVWRVHHDNTESIYRLDVTGDPPPELAEMRERLFREQADDGGEESDTDFIADIPQELSKLVCGFRVEEGDEVFTGLQARGGRATATTRPAQPSEAKPGFLARLFGRR